MTNITNVMAEAKQNIVTKDINERLDYIEKITNRLQQDFKVMSVESSKVHVEYSSQFRRIDENFNEKLRLIGQEIAHLKTVTYPAFWENEIKELKDIVYATRNEIREEVAYWEDFRKKNYFALVTFEEAVRWITITNTQLKELAPILELDISNVSRLLSGEKENDTNGAYKAKENYVAYHKIKAYCMDKFNKTKKTT